MSFPAPQYGTRCFDCIPGTVERLLTGRTQGASFADDLLGPLAGAYERVVLVYLDAFGWRFLERHAEHPLLAAARDDGIVLKLTSQFPSTTAAHTSTVHSGQSVGQHGVYEWFILEPTLDRVIAPLLFSFAGDGERGTLVAAGLAPESVFPADTLYLRLGGAGVGSVVAQSAAFTPSLPSDVLLRGAAVLPFDDERTGLEALAAALGRLEHAYGFAYLDAVDALLHIVGPDAPQVDALIDAQLTLVLELVRERLPSGTLLLLTADHGMSPVSPERTLYVNRIWPELEKHLRRGADGLPLAPAGSCRDLFLHALPGRAAEVVAGLADRLGEVVEVRLVESLLAEGLFGPEPGELLLRRLGDVVVLPRLGEAAYWLEPGRFEQRLHGQHGGLTPEEMDIPLVGLVA